MVSFVILTVAPIWWTSVDLCFLPSSRVSLIVHQSDVRPITSVVYSLWSVVVTWRPSCRVSTWVERRERSKGCIWTTKDVVTGPIFRSLSVVKRRLPCRPGVGRGRRLVPEVIRNKFGWNPVLCSSSGVYTHPVLPKIGTSRDTSTRCCGLRNHLVSRVVFPDELISKICCYGRLVASVGC